MCNLYWLKSSAAEVAALFDVARPITQFNAPEESYPGSPGLPDALIAMERTSQLWVKRKAASAQMVQSLF